MRRHAWFLMPFTCLALACGGDGGGGPSSTGTISGTVTSAASGAPVAGAIVSVGSIESTSDAGGHFELAGVPTGTATVGCSRAGYVAYSASITVQEGSNAQDIALATQEVYQSGLFSLYVPANVVQVRAVIVGLGGPDMRSLSDGRSSASNPVNRAAFHTLGEQLRALARDSGFAVLGSGQNGWVNVASDDAAILAELQAEAAASGHAELASAPLILFAADAGAPGATGLAERQASRTLAFALVHPTGISSTLSAAAQQVPGFFKLAELDEVADNRTITQTILANRSDGAIWELAVEPQLTHEYLTDNTRNTLVSWMKAVAGLRLPAAVSGSLRSVDASSGWVGNLTTYEIAPYASYVGDPLEASWLPTANTALQWQDLVAQ